METLNTIQQPIVQLDDAMYGSMYDEVFPLIASIVSQQGGSRSDAEDIFHDALIAFLDQRFRMAIEDPARYIVGIAKHLWMRRAKLNGRFIKLDDFERALVVPDEVASEVAPSALLQFLQRAGERCMNLLGDFYFSGLSIAQIVTRHGFATDHSASVQKHKCLEKVRNIVKEKQLSHEDFLE